MRRRTSAVRLLAASLTAAVVGCASTDGTTGGTAGAPLAAFATDFLRQVLAAFLL
ncbi:MAG: hypothetical protein CHACPFDD_02294 [Phycisphaerae bacterium]|nr:hypothetical protein [Phycisphaerae bacterium]